MYEGTAGSIRTPSLARQKLVLSLALAIILIVSLLAFVSIERLIAANGRVQNRLTLIVEVNRYLSDLKDVETGGRGYALSDGDIRHLQRQNAGIAAVQATDARLQALSNEPQLQRQLDRLVPLTAERIAASRELVAQRKDLGATRRNLLTGMQLMDRIRDEVGAILATQQREYRDERLHLERQAWITSVALGVGVVLCLIVIAWLFSLRGREVERRRQLEEELRALNLDLEDRVQDRTAEVKHARDLLNAVVENLPDTIFLKEPVDDGFRYLLVNAAGERLLGRERDEILGRTERDLFPTEEAAQVVEANRAVIASGRPRMFTDRKLTTATGVRTVESRMVPIAHNGNPVMILAMIRDVTDAIAREEQFRQLQRMDAVGRLTGGVAHDFNNLLAIIHGNSELLRERFEDGSDAATMTDDVIGAAARGAELVRRLLAFARMQHLEPESIDLNARLQNVLGLLQRALGEAVSLRVKTAKKLWPATVDPTQVDDALVNLAINARDAMPDGGTLSIETQNVALDEDYAASHVEVVAGDYVMLAVSDTGCGMTPDVIARAFEPFFTTKQEGQGTGLGLSQVFGWVKQSRGHIKIYSELGHGTTVKLYLPRAGKQSAGKQTVVETATPKGDETILVVEDNPNVRKTVVRQLHDLGYQTVEAESGAEAMQKVKGGLAFDLLLTDVVMPGGITGYQLADQLRIDRPELKVLFSSGYTELAAAGEDLARKDPLLSKPYRKQDLGRTIRAILDEPVTSNAG
jgi:PAS domain S-box-containing protein